MNIQLLFLSLLALLCLTYSAQGADVQNTTDLNDKHTLAFLALDFKALQVLWNISADPCYPKPWAGIGCAVENSTGLYRVISIDLMRRGLTGKLSPSIVGLSALQTLLLSNNNITGDISRFSFTNLTQLSRVHLDANKFTGTLPTFPPTLTGIVLHNNAFTGPIPSDWFNSSLFSALDEIYISYNQLSSDLSTIPISNSPIQYIDLKSNNFYGAFPVINNSTFPLLVDLSLQNNHFSSKLSNIQYFKGDTLELSGNPIKDTLPSDFSTRFPNLQTFKCDSCLLTGQLPNSLPASMVTFSAVNNQLTGSLPDNWANFLNYSALQSIFLDNNQLSGSIPQAWSRMMAQYKPSAKGDVMFQLQALYLSFNKLTGTLPNWLQDDPRVAGLFFTSRCNNFDGPYPDWCQDSEDCSNCQTGDGGDNRHLAFLWFLLVPGCLVCCLIGAAAYYVHRRGRDGFVQINN